MRLAAIACALAVVGSRGSATAAPTRKVTIETDPPGAAVYLNDVDSGAVCDATPCTIDAPIGQTPIIVRMDRFEPIIDSLDVPKKKGKPQVVKFKLKTAIGTIVVDAASAKGATVKIDEQDKGKVPAHIDVDSGAHHVVVAQGGKTLFDDYVNVDTGEEVPIAIKGGGGAASKDKDKDKDKSDELADRGDDKSDDGGGDGDDKHTPAVTKRAQPSSAKMASVGLVIDLGTRHFVYQNATGGPTANEDESGQSQGGPAIEVWPTAIAGVDALRGLSLFARLEFPVNHQQVIDRTNMMVGTATSWSSLEISVRDRIAASDAVLVDLSAGFVRDQLSFTGNVGKVPNADYKAVRAGVGASLTGTVAPYLALEGRYVLSGGDLASRFTSASAYGVRGAIGLAMKLGPLVGRIEGSALQYFWTFKYDATSISMAAGATDRVLLGSVQLGYAF